MITQDLADELKQQQLDAARVAQDSAERAKEWEQRRAIYRAIADRIEQRQSFLRELYHRAVPVAVYDDPADGRPCLNVLGSNVNHIIRIEDETIRAAGSSFRRTATGRSTVKVYEYGSNRFAAIARQRKDGTRDWSSVVDAVVGHAYRKAVDHEMEAARRRNSGAATEVRAKLGLSEFSQPFSVGPSAADATPVLVKVTIQRAMTPGDAVALYEALKKLRLV